MQQDQQVCNCIDRLYEAIEPLGVSRTTDLRSNQSHFYMPSTVLRSMGDALLMSIDRCTGFYTLYTRYNKNYKMLAATDDTDICPGIKRGRPCTVFDIDINLFYTILYALRLELNQAEIFFEQEKIRQAGRDLVGVTNGLVV